MRRIRRGNYLLAVLLAALLVQPGTAYGVEARQPQGEKHVHKKECYRLICGFAEDGDSDSREVPWMNEGNSATDGRISTPSEAGAGSGDNSSGDGGHTHKRECYELRCPYESGTNGTNSLSTGRLLPLKLPKAQVTGAEKPHFVQDLADECIIYQADTEFTLEVEAMTEDGGTISYEWYGGYSTAASDFSLVQSGGRTYMGQRDDITQPNSRCYFYAVAINTVTGDDGSTYTAERKSNTVKVITSNDSRPTAPVKPVFTKDLTDLPLAGAVSQFTLEAEATVTDGGTVSYNWYQGDDSNAPDSFTRLNGNTGVYTAKVSTLSPAGSYFYVDAVNTLTADGVTQTAKTRSSIARVTPSGVPVEPVFSKNLRDTTVYSGETTFMLQVKAGVDDNGTLTYDWYQGSSESDPASFGRIEEGDDTGSYTAGVDTLASGGSFFYVKAINTLTDAEGKAQTAEKRSDIAEVTISSDERPDDPVAPVLDESGIECATYCAGEPAKALRVKATVTDGGSLSYQWYRMGEGDSKGIPVTGATGNSYMPPTAQAGVTVYYVAVTNRLNALETETVSKQAKITVKEVGDKSTGSIKGKKIYRTPYDAKKAVEEMLKSHYIQLAVTDSSVKSGQLSVLTDFNMTTLFKKAEALPNAAAGKKLSVLLPTGELNRYFAGGSVKAVEYRLVFSKSIWESGKLTVELLLNRKFMQTVARLGVDVNILCVDESGKLLCRLNLTGSSMAWMAEAKTGLFDPDDNGEEVGFLMKYEYAEDTTVLAAAKGFTTGYVGVETPIN